MPDKRLEFIALGLDIASVQSGVNLVSMSFGDKPGKIIYKSLWEKSYHTEHEEGRNKFEGHRLIANKIFRDYLSTGVQADLAVFEDYTNIRSSHVAFSLAEVMALTRQAFIGIMPIMYNVPSRMRSFVANGKKLTKGHAGKKEIVALIEEDFGYRCDSYTTFKQKSDCSEAFIHGVMGCVLCALLLRYNLNLSAKRNSIYYNKKSGIISYLEKFVSKLDKLYERIGGV